MTSNIVFDEQKHEYQMDGIKMPSVTKILGAVGMYKELDKIPRRVLDVAAERGKIVHKIIEFHEKGVLDEETIDPELIGYFNAYLDCVVSKGLAVCDEFEKMVFSEKFRYCGMFDAGSYAAKIIVDHKTTAKPSPVHGLQLTAYWMAEHPDYLHDKPSLLACGYYHNDGTYDFIKYEFLPLVWLNCLAVYNWQRKNGIAK